MSLLSGLKKVHPQDAVRIVRPDAPRDVVSHQGPLPTKLHPIGLTKQKSAKPRIEPTPFLTKEGIAAVQKQVTVFAPNPTGTMYIDKLTEFDFERLVMTAERGLKLAELEAHGCLTADCPHNTQAECDVALAKAYREMFS